MYPFPIALDLPLILPTGTHCLTCDGTRALPHRRTPLLNPGGTRSLRALQVGSLPLDPPLLRRSASPSRTSLRASEACGARFARILEAPPGAGHAAARSVLIGCPGCPARRPVPCPGSRARAPARLARPVRSAFAPVHRARARAVHCAREPAPEVHVGAERHPRLTAPGLCHYVTGRRVERARSAWCGLVWGAGFTARRVPWAGVVAPARCALRRWVVGSVAGLSSRAGVVRFRALWARLRLAWHGS